MGTGIQGWIPKYIRQSAGFRAGTTPTPERFNELYDLLITQGDFNTQTINTLLQNLAGFDVEFSNVLVQTDTRFNELAALMVSNFAQFDLDNTTAHNNISSQMLQAVDLMLQDYVTSGTMSSLLQQKANEILMQVTTELDTNYVDNAKLSAELQLTATNITQTVGLTLQDYATLTEMEASIDLRASGITQTVSEQINGVEQKVTVAQQTADKFSWLVESGDDETNFTLTAKFASMISPEIDFTGYVTFHNLLDPLNITTIDGGHLTSTHIDATTGTIAGFNFSDEDIYGGLIFNDPELGKYIRISPYSSLTGDGGFNTNYGAIDLGLASDGMNTLVHLRSDGYARFGLVSENGVSVRFNDFLRGTTGTDTILYSQNFQIGVDGKVRISSEDIPKSVQQLAVTKDSGQINALNVTFEDGSTVFMPVEYNAGGEVTKIGTTIVSY